MFETLTKGFRSAKQRFQGLAELDEYLAMLRKALERNYQRLDRLLAATKRKDRRS